MKKSTIAIIAVLILSFLGFTAYSWIDKNAKEEAIKKIDGWSYIEGNEYNGGIADHLYGNKDAKVKVIEYADFQCPGCATTYPYTHEVIEEYGDKIAFIFRSYILSYHPNGNAAATAANAASKQGFWDEYASILFSKQDKWENLEGTERDEAFENYFKEASNNAGNLDQFKEDMKSSSIKQKIDFDRKKAVEIPLQSTPSIYVNGKSIEVGTSEDDFKKNLRTAINEALEKAEKE